MGDGGSSRSCDCWRTKVCLLTALRLLHKSSFALPWIKSKGLQLPLHMPRRRRREKRKRDLSCSSPAMPRAPRRRRREKRKRDLSLQQPRLPQPRHGRAPCRIFIERDLAFPLLAVVPAKVVSNPAYSQLLALMPCLRCFVITDFMCYLATRSCVHGCS